MLLDTIVYVLRGLYQYVSDDTFQFASAFKLQEGLTNCTMSCICMPRGCLRRSSSLYSSLLKCL